MYIHYRDMHQKSWGGPTVLNVVPNLDEAKLKTSHVFNLSKHYVSDAKSGIIRQTNNSIRTHLEAVASSMEINTYDWLPLSAGRRVACKVFQETSWHGSGVCSLEASSTVQRKHMSMEAKPYGRMN